MQTIQLQVILLYEGKRLPTFLSRAASDTIASIVQTVLARHGLTGDLTWEVRFGQRVLQPSRSLAQEFPVLPKTIVLEVLVTESHLSGDGAVVDETTAPDGEGDLASLELPEGSRLDVGPISSSDLFPQKVERHATVRYYSRMNPQGTYPLLVILSEEMVQKIAQQDVDQQSAKVKVDLGSLIDIEPILPGCTCYPAKRRVPVVYGGVQAQFWVIPHVLGQVKGAYVEFWQVGAKEPLTEIPLDVRIVNKRWAAFMGTISVGFPFLSAIIKHYKLDFESQLGEGFGFYITAIKWLLSSTPGITAILIGATALAYWFSRPKKKDMFWDIQFGGKKRAGTGWFGSMLRAIVTGAKYSFAGAVSVGAAGAIILALIAWNSDVNQALSAAPVVMGISLTLGVLGGAIIGMVEGWSAIA